MGKKSWDQMKSGQLKKLRDVLLAAQIKNQINAYSGYYRRRFELMRIDTSKFRSITDLDLLPLVERSDLAANPDDFFLRPTRERIQKHGSSRQIMAVMAEMVLRGSRGAEDSVKSEYEAVLTLKTRGQAGAPIPVRLSRRDLVQLAEQGRRMLEIAGVRPDDTILNLLDPESGQFWAPWLGGVMSGLKQSVPGPLPAGRVAQSAAGSGATVLVASPSDVVAMLNSAGAHLSRLRTIILGPGKSDHSINELAKNRLGPSVQVVASYYFAEGRAWWVQCPEGGVKGGFHTYPDLEIWEAIDPATGKRVLAEQPGELVFTGLDQRGTALVRYRPGDLTGGILTGGCPHCGRNVGRIAGPITRTAEIYEIDVGAGPQGFSLDDLEKVMAHPGLAGWEIELTSGPATGGIDDVFVMFRPKNPKEAAHLALRLDEAFRNELGFGPSQFIMSPRASGSVIDLRPSP